MRIMKQKSDVNGYSKISMVIIAIMILLLGYIIGYPEMWQEKRAYKEKLAAASEFASGYIAEKYGFEARIVENEETDSWNKYNNSSKFASCVGYIEKPEDWNFTFDMEADGREFTVKVCIGSEETFANDNYQYEEIKAAALSELETEISRSLPGVNILGIGMGDNYDYSFFSKYYDGNNIDEILESSRGHIEAIFADADFSSPYSRGIIDKLVYEWGFDIRFISFDRSEIMEDFLKHESTYSAIYEYDMYAPHITDIVNIYEGEEHSADSYRLKSCGELIYCSSPYDKNITEADADNAAEFAEIFEENSEGLRLGTPLPCISGVYKMNECAAMYIYIPLDKLRAEGIDADNLGAAWCKKKLDKYECGIKGAVICGDYAVFRMYFYNADDIMFMLVDSAENNE